MKKYLVVLISFVVLSVQAQQIQVPENIYFADIHLSLDASAREKIQKNVDALLKHPTYFQQKIDRADTYFPIVSRVFREAGLPDDFKYLALQESGLNPDAISTSKAEGYWQFKKETALDFGLAINNNVDERRHIMEASRGAAKYFVQSNAYYKNWVNALVSYYMGFTGAKAYASPADSESKNMRITDKTHIYFLTFLAHKIAFENFVGKNPQPAVSLREMRAAPGLTLSEIALANQTSEVELQKYNRWLLGSTVPADKDYYVFIPVSNVALATTVSSSPAIDLNQKPVIPQPTKTETVEISGQKVQFATLNGLKVIIAQAGDTKDKLAMQAKMSTKKFLKLNDMYSFEQIVPGKPYYLQKKKSSAHTEFHVAQIGEKLTEISQFYGMRLKAIIAKNRMKKNEALVSGRVLWLQKTRPSNIAPEYRHVEPKQPNPKVPQPLVSQELITKNTPVQNAEKVGTAVINTIKETASYTLHKAGEAINVPEKQPEVAQVSGDVFEEAIELNPKAKTTEIASETKTTIETSSETKPAQTEVEIKSETAVKTTNPVTSEKPAIVKTEPVQTNTDSPVPTIALKEPTATTNPTSAPEPAGNPQPTETPKTLLPKTVAKTLEKVTDQEPISTPEKTEPVTQIAKTETPEKPAVILRDPVVASGPKTVKITTKPAEVIKPAPANPATHKVAKGETLYAIAKKHNVTPSDLKYWNKLGEKPLTIGQELALNGPSQPVMPVLAVSGPDKPVAEGTTVMITHKVGEGESMYQISRKYGVSIKEIMEWNKKSDFNVSAGDEIMVKSKPGSSRN